MIKDQFQTKMFQSETTTFPQGFRISKNIGHLTLGGGGKKTFKRYLKSEHTDKRTDGQTNRRTFRLIESICSEGRCFENMSATIHIAQEIWGLPYAGFGLSVWHFWINYD